MDLDSNSRFGCRTSRACRKKWLISSLFVFFSLSSLPYAVQCPTGPYLIFLALSSAWFQVLRTLQVLNIYTQADQEVESA